MSAFVENETLDYNERNKEIWLPATVFQKL
jgi:hypothetical protein